MLVPHSGTHISLPAPALCCRHAGLLSVSQAHRASFSFKTFARTALSPDPQTSPVSHHNSRLIQEHRMTSYHLYWATTTALFNEEMTGFFVNLGVRGPLSSLVLAYILFFIAPITQTMHKYIIRIFIYWKKSSWCISPLELRISLA